MERQRSGFEKIVHRIVRVEKEPLESAAAKRLRLMDDLMRERNLLLWEINGFNLRDSNLNEFIVLIEIWQKCERFIDDERANHLTPKKDFVLFNSVRISL